MLSIVKSWGLFFVFSWLIGCRDLFSGILNLLQNLELLIYSEPLLFMVGGYNIYGGVFYQIYLLPHLTINYFSLLLWNYGDVVVGCWINSTSLSGYEKVFCDCLNEDFL